MRIHHGPGYRVYFKRAGMEIVILLAGGDKSTQAKDIKKALKLARESQEMAMALKLSKWDVAEHLKTDEDMALYLEAAMEEAGDDAPFIAKVLGDIARAKGMTQMSATLA